MKYRELTTRVVQAGLGLVTSPEEATDDDSTNRRGPEEQDADDPLAGISDLIGTVEGRAMRAMLPTLPEVPERRRPDTGNIQLEVEGPAPPERAAGATHEDDVRR